MYVFPLYKIIQKKNRAQTKLTPQTAKQHPINNETVKTYVKIMIFPRGFKNNFMFKKKHLRSFPNY